MGDVEGKEFLIQQHLIEIYEGGEFFPCISLHSAESIGNGGATNSNTFQSLTIGAIIIITITIFI